MAQNLQQVFTQATQLHQQARLADAERLYRQILMQVQHPSVVNALAVLLQQTGRANESLQLMQPVVSHSSVVPEFLLTYAMALRALQRNQEAVTVFKRVIALRPDFPAVLVELGNAHADLAQHEQAARAFQSALRLAPDDPAIHFNLGNALSDLKRSDEAVAAFTRAIALQPRFAAAYNNRGSEYLAQNRFEQALFDFQQARQIEPNFADAHYNTGNALRQLKRYHDALAACETALAIDPRHAKAHLNRGVMLLDMGRVSDAEPEIRLAVSLMPAAPEARFNLARVLMDTWQISAAEPELREAIRLRPGFVEAHVVLGNCLGEQGRTDEAIVQYQRAIELDPKFFAARNTLAGLYKDTGRLSKSIDLFRESFVIDPAEESSLSSVVFSMMFQPGVDDRAILAEARRWDELFGQPLRSTWKPHENDATPDRPLRIGYISPDFRSHCQSLFTSPLFANHDRSQFEIHCYSGVSRPDSVTDYLRSLVDHWRTTNARSDEEVAEMIRADQIDILVDLTMHMGAGRRLVTARKPAPVQIAYLAYPGTTGMSAIDYRLSDPYLDPPGQLLDQYSEQTIHLPHTFWCYEAQSDLPINDLPAMKNGFVTFGNLNNFCKFNRQTWELWSAVMTQVPESRLIMICPKGEHRNAVLREFQTLGIAAGRIELLEKAPRADYLKFYHGIDLGLDSFPYNGHTTTLDSLFMGVPVVSTRGPGVMGRAGWSQANNLKLTELIGRDSQEFVDITVRLANDLPRLADMRKSLRQKLLQSPICDAPAFAKDIEHVYRQAWRTWCEQPSRTKPKSPIQH